MRYEKPQRGRLREHWQFNCDIFGAPNSYGEFEILQLLISLLKSFGATKEHFSILINDRAITDELFSKVLKLDKEKSYKLYKIVDKSKKITAEALNKILVNDFEEDQVQIIKDYLNCNSLEKLISFAKEHSLEHTTLNLQQLYSTLESTSLSGFLTYDPAIVRGLDYYTGIVFEVFDLHPDNKRAICGGGSYANLLQIFDEPPLAGVGFGLGDVTLSDFLATHNLLPDFSTPSTDILITFQESAQMQYALKVCSQIREHWKKNIEFHPIAIKFKKGFQIAEKKQINNIVIIGADEMQNGMLSIKNLKTKESTQINLEQVKDKKVFK
jgi:histidyl-tRNA synthetase